MVWLIAYGIGAMLMIVVCGMASADGTEDFDLALILIVAALWPVMLPWSIGIMLGSRD